MNKTTCSSDTSTSIYHDTTKPQYAVRTIVNHSVAITQGCNSNYLYREQKNITNEANQIYSTIENVAIWFLNQASFSHKKLQKLCYYAYCWYIVFFNDKEMSTIDKNKINVLCSDKFQAWIHGPVSPKLYQKYKTYGWRKIPCPNYKPIFDSELEELFHAVLNTYGDFSAEELEMLSHNETPWVKARKGVDPSEPCSNEISDFEILKYYSTLRNSHE